MNAEILRELILTRDSFRAIGTRLGISHHRVYTIYGTALKAGEPVYVRGREKRSVTLDLLERFAVHVVPGGCAASMNAIRQKAQNRPDLLMLINELERQFNALRLGTSSVP